MANHGHHLLADLPSTSISLAASLAWRRCAEVEDRHR